MCVCVCMRACVRMCGTNVFYCVQARKAIALRSTMEKKLANIEREKKEDNLRQLAQKARDARVGLRAPANEGRL